jgi:L-threonylcarbamoyladenylate synthase
MSNLRQIKNINPQEYAELLGETGLILRRGGVVIYPTDTVYGIGGLISSTDSLERIFSLKKRPLNLALPVIIAEYEDLAAVASYVPEEARRLMQRFWPGALTIVLPAREGLSPILLSGKKSVGVRMPGSNFCRDMIRSAGGPLVSTSANPSGEPPANDVRSIPHSLTESVDLVIDGGALLSGNPSTVVDLSLGNPVIRRLGSITKDELKAILPKLE